MSYSTTAVLLALSSEGEAISQVNCWLKVSAQGQQLDPADLHGGGGFNFLGHSVWTADFDYLDLAGFLEAVSAAPVKADRLVLSEADRW
jgi:hypothetical protein